MYDPRSFLDEAGASRRLASCQVSSSSHRLTNGRAKDMLSEPSTSGWGARARRVG